MKSIYKLILACLICPVSIFAMDSEAGEEKKGAPRNIQSLHISQVMQNLQISDSALINAIEDGSDELARILIASGESPSKKDKNGICAITLAAQKANYSILDALIAVRRYIFMSDQEKVEYDTAINTALHSVIFKIIEDRTTIAKYSSIIKNLMIAGINPIYILVQLAQYHIDEIALPLITHIARKSSFKERLDGKTILWLVAQDSNIFKLVVESGAKINEKNDDDGQTALMRIAQFGDDVLLDYLISKKVDLNIKDKEGTTALIHATKLGYLEIVKKLVNAGANMGLKDQSGRTAFTYADNKSQRKNGQIYQQILDLFNNEMNARFNAATYH